MVCIFICQSGCNQCSGDEHPHLIRVCYYVFMADEEMITTRRLEALTDGIFAFSMTLLVVFIETPKPHHLNNPQQLQIYLTEQFPQFVSYVITFLILAIFWILHHHLSSFIIKTDYKNLWLNIIFMLCIVFLPFTSMILGDYPAAWGSTFLFVVNLFALCTLLLILWLYANHRKLITPDLVQKRAASMTDQLSIGVFFSFVSIIVSFFSPSTALYGFLFIPIFIVLYKLNTQMKSV